MLRVRLAGIAAIVVAACGLIAGCVPSQRAPAGAPVTLSASTDDLTIQTVDLPYRSFGVARRVGATLFLNVDSGEGIADTIIAYDLDSMGTEVMVESDDEIGGLAADDDWLMWEADKKLFARSRSTGETREVSSSRDELYAPALEGDHAAWVDLTPEQEYRVVVFDLATRKLRTVASVALPGFYNNFMDFHDGVLVWTDVVDDAGVYRLFELSTGKLREYVLRDTRFRFPGYVRATDGRVYSLNFDKVSEWDWTNTRLGYLDLATGEFVEIPTTSHTNYFGVAGDWLGVVDGEQRFTLRRMSRTDDSEFVTPVGDTPIDWVGASEEGFVASRMIPGAESFTLYVIGVR